MKIKRLLLLLVSMLAVMFSMTGCDSDVEKPFEYDETEIVLYTMSCFSAYSNIDDEYAQYYLEGGTAFEQSAIKGIEQAETTDNVGAFDNYSYCEAACLDGTFTIDMVDAEIVNTDDSVSVTIINKAENRDVEITVTYVENPAYYMEYNEFLTYYAGVYECTTAEIEQAFGSQIRQRLSQKGVYPFTPEEMVVSAVYSKAELMKQAGLNTLIGMGTVFIVLIFISFIISLFKYLPALFEKKPKEVPEKSDNKKAAAPVVEEKNLTDDAELVAVITAAVYAAAGQNGAVSRDKLVVRSIKRAKR